MKTLFERLGGSHTRCGDYLIPDFVPPKKENVGIWGERRRRYLRASNRNLYDALLLSGRLEAHLAEIDRNATEMLETLTAKLKSLEGVIEKLKAEDQLAWVRAMNSIRNRAEEIVTNELIINQ